MKIEWTQSAELDLCDLYDWIAKDSPANEDYRAFYLVTADCLYILGIIHGSRDLANMQRKPWK